SAPSVASDPRTTLAAPPPPPPPPATPPGAPTNVLGTLGDRQATVTWGSAEGPVVRYRVSASPGGSRVTVDAPATSATVPDVDNGTSYSFTVVALSATNDESAPAMSGTIPSLKAVADWYMTGSLGRFLQAKDQAAPPYNWIDDGCGGLIPLDPCKRHDFGYRN